MSEKMKQKATIFQSVPGKHILKIPATGKTVTNT